MLEGYGFKENVGGLRLFLESISFQVGEVCKAAGQTTLMTFLTQGPQGVSSNWIFTKPTSFLPTSVSPVALTVCLEM